MRGHKKRAHPTGLLNINPRRRVNVKEYIKSIKMIIDEGEKENRRLKKRKLFSNFFKHPFVLSLLKHLIIPVILVAIYLYTPLGTAQ